MSDAPVEPWRSIYRCHGAGLPASAYKKPNMSEPALPVKGRCMALLHALGINLARVIIRSAVFACAVFIFLVPSALGQTMVVNIWGSGSDIKEYIGVDFSQRVEYNLEVELELHLANPVVNGDLVTYQLTRKIGTIHFSGTATQVIPNETTVFSFNEPRNFDIQLTEGFFEHSTVDHTYRNVDFEYPPPPVPPGTLPYPRKILYSANNGSEPVLSVRFDMPYPFNLGYLDNVYDVPGADDFCFFSLDFNNYNPLPGDTVEAKAVTPVDPGDTISWKIIPVEGSTARAKITPGGDSGKSADISDIRGEGILLVQATNPSIPGCQRVAPLNCGCECGDSTDTDSTCGINAGYKANGIDVAFGLGRTTRGNPVGNILLKKGIPDPVNATPELLDIYTFGEETEILKDGNTLRQVVTKDVFADITVINPYSYHIKYYDLADKGPKVGGFYQVAVGAIPLKSWLVENPDASASVFHRLRITELDTSPLKIFEYIWDAGTETWILDKGEGLQIEATQEQTVGNLRVVTRVIEDDLGQIASETQTTYKDINTVDGPIEEIIEVIEDPNGFALTTTTAWYEDPTDTGNFGNIQSIINPDGSWTTFQYDSLGRTTVEVHSWLDAPFGAPASSTRAVFYDYSPQDASDSQAAEDERRPRMVTEQILGQTVSKTFYVYTKNPDGSRTTIMERCITPDAVYGDPQNQRTITETYPYSFGSVESWRTRTVTHPGGQKDVYSYDTGTYTPNADPTRPGTFTPGAGTDERENLLHVSTASPLGVPFKSIATQKVTNNTGEKLLEVEYIYDGNAYQPFRGSVWIYDDFGHVIANYNSNLTFTEATWNCCSQSSETAVSGITHDFTFDALNQLITKTKQTTGNDVVTIYDYDTAGRQTTEVISAGSLSLAIMQDYDTAGRLLTSTDPAGLSTTYSYSPDNRTTTVNRPGGATEITEQYIDGQTKNVTGSGVIGQYYTYGVNPDGSRWTRVNFTNASSPNWEKTTVDMLGRVIKQERPGFSGVEVTEHFYDNLGWQVKTMTTGQADTLFEYDELGNQIRRGLDVDANGSLELSATDRITDTETRFTNISGAWWQERVQKVYAADNDPTATVMQTQRNRLSLFGSAGKVAETLTTDIHDNQTVDETFIDRTLKTETRIVNYPDSTTDAVSIIINGLLTSDQSKTGINITFSYDDLERRIGVTDPRTGTTVTQYNPATGQVDFVQEPAGNKVSFTYDAAGRVGTETNELLKVTRFDYNDRNQVTHTWGDVPYPVRNEYDAYGRLNQMHTWRTSAAWGATVFPVGIEGQQDVTTWNYQEATGLLTSKVDDAGESVSYTYESGGRLQTRTWARLEGGSPLVTTYNYDPDTAELLDIDYSDSTPDIAFTYDRLGRQKTITDAVGDRTFSYNADLQLASETITGLYDQVITRTYESGAMPGRNTGITLGADYTVTYGYDGVGRFNSIAWDVAGVSDAAGYTYLQDSDLLDQLTINNGPRTTYDYEPERNLRTRVKNELGASLISQYDYQYDELGRRSSVVNSGQAFAAVNSAFNLNDYDDRSEVIESARYIGNNISNTSNPVESEYRSYEYDPIGNRIQNTEGADAGTYTSNALNQYTLQNTPGGGTNNFTYDLDGNLTEISDGTVTTEYLYNAENRLIAVQQKNPVDGDKKVEFTYDHMGRRVQKKVYSWQTDNWSLITDNLYLYNGWNLIYELTSGGERSGDKYYIWGLDLSQTIHGAGGVGGLIASYETLFGDFDQDGDTDGSDLAELANNPNLLDLSIFSSNFGNSSGSYYYLYDGNGNVGQLIESGSGNVVAHYGYDSFGNIVHADGVIGGINLFRFSTKYFDTETGLYYYGYRYYSSELGRWLSRDTIAERGGLNLYVFVDNNAPNSVDYLGEISAKEVWQTIKSAVSSLGSLLWGFTEEIAKQQDAIGIDLGASFVATTGLKIGANGMFYPETCELASYWYGSGSLRADKVEEDKNAVVQLVHAMPVGLNIGASGELVKATPIGSKVHGADSWLGWFYTGSGQVGLGGTIGIGGSVFASDTWVGASVGPGVGPGVPVGPVTVSGDIASLYFDELGGRWVSGVNYLELHDHKCACAALRALSMESNEVLAIILKKLFK